MQTTTLEVDALESAIDNHPGSNTICADKTCCGAPENGSTYHPYDTFNEAIGAVPTGGKISITAGMYNDTGFYTKEMFLVAPVGNVLIGR